MTTPPPYTAAEVAEVAYEYAGNYASVPGYELLPIPRLVATYHRLRTALQQIASHGAAWEARVAKEALES